jgi:long-chain fatty acid transport protein
VYRPEDSRLTYGFGVYAAGGFAVNYPASRTNPILTPQLPNGIGLGNLSAQFVLAQISPTVSYQLTDHLALGFSPTIDIADLNADPAFIAPPDITASGFPRYSSATHSRWTWGLGFEAGAYYTTDAGWNFGASVKSPQWFEPFRYNATDATGFPRIIKFHFDYPLMASTGVSYTGFDRWLLAADFRFVDYHNTPGFSQFGFDQFGAAKGLGFDSVFCVALGAQYKLTDCLALRCGYTFNTNPIPDSRAAFNVASPVIIEHTLCVGASYNVSQCLTLSVAYAHLFQNSITGPYITPLGTVPGSSVSSTVSADSLLVGASVKF